MTEAAQSFESMDTGGVLEYMRQHSDSYILCSFALRALSEKLRAKAVIAAEQDSGHKDIWNEANDILAIARLANTGQ